MVKKWSPSEGSVLESAAWSRRQEQNATRNTEPHVLELILIPTKGRQIILYSVVAHKNIHGGQS